jgi:pectate lyase
MSTRPGLARHPRARTTLAAAVAVVMAAFGMVAVSSPAALAQTIDPNAWYEIESRHSSLLVDICGQSTADGACVQQYSRANQANQQFRFVPVGSGYYRIEARHSSKAIDVSSRSTANGAEIIQWPNNGGTNQHWQPVNTGSGFVKLINRHSGKALDVWEWSTANGGRLSQYDDTGATNQQWRLINIGGGGQPPPQPPPQPPAGGPIGWAAMNGGTTGGAGGQTVTVTNTSQFLNAIRSNNPMIIRVQGTITLSAMERVQSNKSILGNGSNATITGGGLEFRGAQNIIVRNINFINNTIGEGDALDIGNSTRNIWIDHNTFSGQADGSVDIKRESDFITVSWNRFNGTNRTMLLGHSDGHTADIGHLRVTYHHNWFNGSDSRHPRVRFGNPVHVFNNYYLNNSGYGVASTMNAGVRMEANYFQNVSNPSHVGYASSGPGSLTCINNVFVNSGNPECTSGGVNTIPYSYQLDNPNNIPNIVSNGAGAGRISP